MWLFGALLLLLLAAAAAQQQHLLQRIQQQDDAAADTDADDKTFECFVRYLRNPQKPGVLLLHANHPDVTRYATAICRASPLTLLNVGSGDMGTIVLATVPVAVYPYGLLVVLVATQQELRHHHLVFTYFEGPRRHVRVLAVVTTAVVAILPEVIGRASASHLWNVAVLVVGDTRVYTYFPYGRAVCGWWWTPESLGSCERLLHLDQLYTDKEPGQFNGCLVTLDLNEPPPAVIDGTSRSEQPLVAGYELALANLIFGRLNLTWQRLENTFFRRACESSHSYYADRVRWYVPVAGYRAQWQGPVLLFSTPLWLAVLACFVFNTLVWWAAGIGSIAHCLLGSLVTLLNGAASLPRRTHRRFLVTAWTLCALVLVAAYQSQLLSTLLTPVPDPQPITTVEQLFASDMPVLYDIPVDKGGSAERIQGVRASPKPPAVLRLDMTTRYRARNLTDARGNPTLYAIPEPPGYRLQCLKFDDRTALLRRPVKLLARLAENGLVAKFLRDVDFSDIVAEVEDEPLTLGHLGFAFVALLLGSALASLTFALEVVGWRLRHGWWQAFCTGVKWCVTRVQGCWRTGATTVRRRGRRGCRRWRGTFRRRVLAQLDQ